MSTRQATIIGSFVLGLIFIVFGFIFWVGTYNELNTTNQNVIQKRAQVEIQCQRRYDLIPQILASVKDEVGIEKQTLEAITQARASATQVRLNLSDAKQLENFQAQQGAISQALSRLLVANERYPDLKFNQAFQEYRTELEGTENRISVSRRDLSLAISQYTQLQQGFFSSIVADHYKTKFPVYSQFQAEEGAQTAPRYK